MKTEIALLREIADEAKRVWDKGILPLEAVSLGNLLTDRIDFNERHATEPAESTDSICKVCGRGPGLGRDLSS